MHHRISCIFTVILFSFVYSNSFGQDIIKQYNPLNLSRKMDSLRTEFGDNKEYPIKYELQILAALSHYPELIDIKIKFKERKGGAPLVSRPTVWSTFFRRKHKRTYLILMRTERHAFMDPILMHNMPFEAQIGAMGHEIAHTVDFANRNVFKMFNVIFGNLSRKYLDRFEFETDRRAIEHGLGYQLLAWSSHTWKSFGLIEPDPVQEDQKIEGIMQRERYMRPSTIIREIQKIEAYSTAINAEKKK